MGYQDEVYFCGSCERQQETSRGEKCTQCGKQTVTWDTSRQKIEDVRKNWRRVNGLPTS